MAGYDHIVIGAGHNGLVCATVLARKGRRVLVVEKAEQVGGLAASWEFHPGFRSPGLLRDVGAVRPAVIDGLGLAGHGLEVLPHRPGLLALGAPGDALWLDGDPHIAGESIAARNADDGGAWDRYRSFHGAVQGVLGTFVDEPPLDVIAFESNSVWEVLGRAFGVRRLGRRTMMELLRVAPMPVADWLNEFFVDDVLKAALALPAVAHTFAGPRSPTTNAALLCGDAAARTSVVGGGPALIATLERAAAAAGVEVRTGADVSRIRMEGDAVAGVTLSGGEEIDAASVVSSADPKTTLLGLLEPGVLGFGARTRTKAVRSRGTTAQVLLAIDGPVLLSGHDAPVEYARVAPSLDAIEQAHDAIKYGEFAPEPILDVHIATVGNPGLAPAGKSVVSVHVHFAPYDLDAGWDTGRDLLGGRVVSMLDAHAPGLASKVESRVVLAPPDIEQRFGVAGGCLDHVEHALDQLLIRPIPDCSGYVTPIPGLALCGSGLHPGGGLSGAPGWLAATVLGG